MNKTQKRNPFQQVKIVAFFILLICVIVQAEYNFKFSKINDWHFLKISFLYWVLGYIVVVIFSFFLHYAVYLRSLSRLKRKGDKVPFWNCMIFWIKECYSRKFLIFVISPDYMYAKIFKEILYILSKRDTCIRRDASYEFHTYRGKDMKCEFHSNTKEFECELHEKKRRRKLYILGCNWANLSVISILTVILIFSISPDNSEEWYKKLIFVFVFLHTLSRVIEISYAFYKDVVKARMKRDLNIGEKRSTLKRGNRISLAVHSYLEVTLLFSLLYYLNPTLFNDPKGDNFFECLLYSFSVSAFNISFDNNFPIFQKFIHVVQVFTNINLVVLSIANYLGMEDSMSEYEKADWEEEEYI